MLQYLGLLQTAVAEEPRDARMAHYLGRELMFVGRYAEAIAELERHLTLEDATWDEERAVSLRFIAECHAQLGDAAAAQRAALRGVLECAWTREPWLELARRSRDLRDWPTAWWAAKKALGIGSASAGFVAAASSWGSQPHELAAEAAYGMGLLGEAVAQGELAVSAAPGDARLAASLEQYRAGVAGLGGG